MVAVVARPPFDLHKNNFLTKNWLFYIYKPHNAMNEAKFFTKLFEEASELFVSKNWEKWSEKCVENVTLRGITPTLRPISRMAPVSGIHYLLQYVTGIRVIISKPEYAIVSMWVCCTVITAVQLSLSLFSMYLIKLTNSSDKVAMLLAKCQSLVVASLHNSQWHNNTLHILSYSC